MNKTKCNSGKKHNTEEELMQSYLNDIFGSILEEDKEQKEFANTTASEDCDIEFSAFSFLVEQNDGRIDRFKSIEQLNEFLEEIDCENIASVMEIRNIMVETKTKRVFQAIVK